MHPGCLWPLFRAATETRAVLSAYGGGNGTFPSAPAGQGRGRRSEGCGPALSDAGSRVGWRAERKKEGPGSVPALVSFLPIVARGEPPDSGDPAYCAVQEAPLAIGPVARSASASETSPVVFRSAQKS